VINELVNVYRSVLSMGRRFVGLCLSSGVIRRATYRSLEPSHAKSKNQNSP